MRYEELDSLRGLAAVTVFFSHSMLAFGPPDIFVNSFLHVFWDGNAAVYLFFVLSGFCLSLPYMSEKKFKIWPFLLRRVFRIYPAYLFSLILALVLRFFLFDHSGLAGLSGWFTSFWKVTVNWQDLLKHFILIGPEFDNTINAVIWTLVVEMKMSLLMPAIILVLKRANAVWSQLTLFVISFAVSIFMFNYDKSGFLSAMYLFVAGSLLAKNRDFVIRHLQRFGYQMSLLILALFLYDFRYSTLGLVSYGFLVKFLIMTGCILIISIVMASPVVSSFLRSKPLVVLGQSSYSLYLVHFPLMLTFTSLFYHSVSLAFSLSLSLGVSIGLAYLIYKYIEVPFIKLGHYCSDLNLGILGPPRHLEQSRSPLEM